MKKIASVVTITAVLATLAGCVYYPRRPPYVVPEGAATANIKSAILGAYGRNDVIDVYVLDGQCSNAERKQLFRIHHSLSDPAGYVKVPANQPLRLEYSEGVAGRGSCIISAEVDLEPGKNYSLVGGFEYKPGPIPILTGTRMCKLAVQDDTDKKFVTRKPSCQR